MTDTATELAFGTVRVEPDAFDPPQLAEIVDGTVPFDPQYPDSTPEAPYGYKANGEPYTRHHGGKGKRESGGGKRSNLPATAQAATAAALLSRLNALVGISLTMAGMPESARQLAENNEQFEVMARESLSADPALCRKILSAGATSGKTGLAMAYLMLGASTFPAMKNEYRLNHPKETEDDAAHS